MNSMTGFSENGLRKNSIEFKCIAKSLNSRFLEIHIKLPNNLKSNEGWIREMLQKNFSRGKVELEIFYNRPDEEHLSISPKIINKIKNNEKAIRSKGLNLQKISYSEILKISEFEQKHVNIKQLDLKRLVKKSIITLKDARSIEGDSIKKDLIRIIKSMNRNISQIQKLETKNIKKAQEKIKKMHRDFQATSSELNISEALSSLSKTDINEEIVRFKSHLALVSKLISSKKIIGKKLDFYSQEMVREANTISSKAIIVEIKNRVVDLKSFIEKVKEHAQNIE
tara:strand:- start:1089 stop:1934 length:846 start_codon:yes stop_codon:yes gene_type:complete